MTVVTTCCLWMRINYIREYEYSGSIVTDYHASAAMLRAIAHPVRLEIVDMLRQGEICVCHIEAALKRRQAYVSQQLMVLREAGLVECRKDGLQVFYQLATPEVTELLTVLCGTVDSDGHKSIDGCPCPGCSPTPSVNHKR